MARYGRTYIGERRTVKRTVKLTPSEAAELDAAAVRAGELWSDYARLLWFRRSAVTVAGTRRNPEAAALAREISAIGNNLNQLAREQNTTGTLRHPEKFDELDELIRQALARVIAL